MAQISFDTKNTAFFSALRLKVDEYFAHNNLRTTGNTRLYWKTAILITTLVVNYVVLVFFTPPVFVSLLLCALMGLNFAAIGFNVMHDGAHGSFSTRSWVNNMMGYSLNLLGGSSYLWKLKHNVIHHSFTNIEGVDDDIDIKPWIRTHKNQKWYWFHKFQHVYAMVLYCSTYLLWIYVQDYQKYFSRQIQSTKLKKFALKEHIIFWSTKVLYISIFVLIPIFQLGLVETLVGYLVLTFVCGLFIAVVFQLAHVVENTEFPMPHVETNKIEEEWAVHQINTTANFATKNKIVSWFTGGLNYQVEHHLFPKISHIHYPAISKIVKETCEQFNLRYLEFPTVRAAIMSHIMYLKAVGVN
jgi:linoleoyl-CoA desaturase